MPDIPASQYCQSPQGYRVAWREWGHGAPLVLLHGWSMSSVVFAELAPMLADKYRVLCPDLPGHGDSEAIAICTLEAYVDWLADWTEVLGLAKFSLLGWSLGGQLALRFAASQPVSLGKLLLIATTPCFCQRDGWLHGLPKSQINLLQRNLGRAYEKTMGDFYNLQFAGEELPKERYRQILAFAVRPGRLPEAQCAEAALVLLGQVDLRSFLPRISVPTIILHGTLDQIIPIGAGEYLADVIAGASLQRFAGIGHAPFFSQPERSGAKILEFLT